MPMTSIGIRRRLRPLVSASANPQRWIRPISSICIALLRRVQPAIVAGGVERQVGNTLCLDASARGCTSYSGVTKVSPKPCNADAYFSCPAFSTHTTQTSIMQDGTNTTMHTPNTKYSPHSRAKIAIGFELGLQRPTLKHKTSVNPVSVSGLIARYKIQKLGKSRLHSSRPRCLEKHDLRRVFALIDKDPFISNDCLYAEAGLTYCTRTLIRELI